MGRSKIGVPSSVVPVLSRFSAGIGLLSEKSLSQLTGEVQVKRDRIRLTGRRSSERRCLIPVDNFYEWKKTGAGCAC
jgi:hypothetical protein